MFVLLKCGFDLTSLKVDTFVCFEEAYKSMKAEFIKNVKDELCLEPESVAESTIESLCHGTQSVTVGMMTFKLEVTQASIIQTHNCYSCDAIVGVYPVLQLRIFEV